MGLRTAQEVLSELGKARLAVVTFEQIPVVVEVAGVVQESAAV